jgi:N-acyl-D-amino-acid deacylase
MICTIINGLIVDGTGAPAYTSDLIVEDRRIAAVGKGLVAQGQVLDARGKVVSPGFIDMHSHSSLWWLVDGGVDPKVLQGITTEAAGVDGLSVAPLGERDVQPWRTYLEALDPGPPVDWNWRSFGEYVDRLTGLPNHAAPLVGHGALRVQVMGMDRREPTNGELQAMSDALRECIAQGAHGLSTGLGYEPCAYAAKAELVALASVVAEQGCLFNIHMRLEGARAIESIKEVIEIGQQSGAAMHICHFKVMGRGLWGSASRLLAMVDEARLQGVDLTIDLVPYTAAMTKLAALIPPWAQAGGQEALMSRLRSIDTLGKIRDQIESDLPGWESLVRAAGWDGIRISWVRSTTNAWVIGKSLVEISEVRGTYPFEAMVWLLQQEEGEVGITLFMMCEEDIESIMRAPWQMFGTDGLLGGKPHPRAYGTFPRVLGRYVRERGVLRVEQAIRKCTGLAAQRLGLRDRGTIREGCWADLCVFDPDTILDLATYDEPRLQPRGIEHVFVNGQLVVHEGTRTNSLPGHFLEPA